jgi:hypothetical protein
LRQQKIVHGPFNRSQLIREALKTVLIARDSVKAEKAKAS